MTHTCTKVTVRQRAIRNNRISLYLDYYPAVRNPETMQMSRREYLGIYIYAYPKNEMEREFNNDMLNKAEAIRCIRVQSLINEEFGFLDKTKQKADFLAYFKKMCRNKDQKWQFVYQHFYNFVKGQCTFGDVNVDLCKKFREYLLNAKQLKHSNRPISLNSASGYYSTFRGLLKIAYRDKWLRENINDYLDKIEPQDVKKEYLTLDEVKQLAATSLRHPRSESSFFVCLPDRATHQRYSQSSMGRFCHCPRPRLLLAYQNTENPNGSDPSHKLRSLRAMWYTRNWQGIQRLETKYD